MVLERYVTFGLGALRLMNTWGVLDSSRNAQKWYACQLPNAFSSQQCLTYLRAHLQDRISDLAAEDIIKIYGDTCLLEGRVERKSDYQYHVEVDVRRGDGEFGGALDNWFSNSEIVFCETLMSVFSLRPDLSLMFVEFFRESARIVEEIDTFLQEQIVDVLRPIDLECLIDIGGGGTSFERFYVTSELRKEGTKTRFHINTQPEKLDLTSNFYVCWRSEDSNLSYSQFVPGDDDEHERHLRRSARLRRGTTSAK
jgi:hypothetical protein